MDAAHRMGHKTVLYNESCRVPFLVKWPGHTPRGGVNHTHLISTGLDLTPTLCELAGRSIPPELAGRSLVPLLNGQEPISWRDYVPVESQFGYAAWSANYSYVLYDEGENAEQLYDLLNDPGQMRNALNDPELASILSQHRAWLKNHLSRY